MTARRAYPRKSEIDRALKAARDFGLRVGGVEITSDGTIKVLAEREAVDNAYDRWKAGQKGE